MQEEGPFPPPTLIVMILIGGVLMRKFKPGHKALRRVQARGMSDAVAQETHQGEAEVLPEGNLALC